MCYESNHWTLSRNQSHANSKLIINIASDLNFKIFYMSIVNKAQWASDVVTFLPKPIFLSWNQKAVVIQNFQFFSRLTQRKTFQLHFCCNIVHRSRVRSEFHHHLYLRLYVQEIKQIAFKKFDVLMQIFAIQIKFPSLCCCCLREALRASRITIPE